MPVPALLLVDRKIGRSALLALAAAADAEPGLGAEIRFVRGREGLAEAASERLGAGRAVVAAWSFCSPGLAEAAADLAWTRRRVDAPRLWHVAGGPHASADPEGTLRAGFDLAAVGEGEGTIVALLRRAAAGLDPRGAPGIAWLAGAAVERSRRAEPVDLDAAPPFAPRLGRFGPIEITRGCAWACRFCQTPSLHRARFRHRSVESVARAVAALAAAGLRDVRFVTPSALSYGAEAKEARLDRVEALLAAARRAAGPGRRIFLGSFPSEIRPEHVSREALRMLRRLVDNDNLVLGGESGSDRLLAACGRGHEAEAVRRAARLAAEAGFRAHVDLIFGLPGETAEDAAATRSLVRDLDALGAAVHAHAFLPLPGTPWRGAPAGAVDPETRRLLDRLASRGRAWGQWRRQEALASSLRGAGGSAGPAD